MLKCLVASDGYIDSFGEAIGIETDEPDQALAHVDELDGEGITLVSIEGPEATLFIGGGENGKYICTYEIYDKKSGIASLGNDDAESEIMVGGQPCNFRKKNLIALTDIEEIVRQFMKDGSVPARFDWGWSIW